MNPSNNFRNWLSSVRFSRKVCMLIPMEARMGFPIAVKNGSQYILPFFSGTVMNMSPPFAYIRVSYPKAAILTYNDLRTLPEWQDTDGRNITTIRTSAEKLNRYYRAITAVDGSINYDAQDEMLLDYIRSVSAEDDESPAIMMWYEKLIDEAKKYR